MSLSTKAVPKKTNEAVNDLIDLTCFSSNAIDDLGALLIAIRDASNKGTLSFRLAGVGMALANKWREYIDTTNETLQTKLIEISDKEGELI
ncbi:MAG: hypothetical protein KUG82_18895 [Pseudomonadales bacterium]|nr:hypothetical protein [Pseudomonadales bacterium]